MLPSDASPDVVSSSSWQTDKAVLTHLFAGQLLLPAQSGLPSSPEMVIIATMLSHTLCNINRWP